MKKKIILAALGLILIFVLANRLSQKQAVEAQPAAKGPQPVSVQSAADSTTLKQSIQYPAVVSGDDEITVTAKSTGNAAVVNFDLGSKVGLGTLLVKIDNTGNNLGIGDNGFRSSQVQQSQLSVEQAKEQVDVAKKNRDSLETLFDRQKNSPATSKTVTKAQIKAANEQVDIAKIELENAKVGLGGTLDDHLVTSPIAGIVTKKSVSVGDSVSTGQELAMISKTALTKVQFFVAKEDLSSFQPGTNVVINEDGTDIPGVVARVAPEADAATKRFLVEAKPAGKTPLVIGTVITVSFDAVRLPSAPGNLLLPLSAVTIGQNENFVFLAVDGHAKKTNVDIVRVQGEFAEIKADIPADAEIIIEGSKLVRDGDAVEVKS